MEVKDIELQACPHCGGDGVIEDEGGWCVYVTCCDCGAHTAQVDYHSPEERLDARKARRVCLEHRQGRFQSPRRIKNRKKLPVGILRRAALCGVSPAQSRA